MKTQQITTDFVDAVEKLKKDCPVSENMVMWTVFVASMSAIVSELRKEVEALTTP